MNRRVTIAAALAATTLTIAVAAPAEAYAAGSCHVSPDGVARLSVTKWNITGGQRYHLDLNSSTPWLGTKYYQAAITFDGVRLSGTNDVYRDTGGGTHTVRGYWTMSGGTQVSCGVTL